MNIKETPTNPRTHRTPRIRLAGALDFSQRLTTILAAVTAFIFARNHLLAALSLPLHNRIAHPSSPSTRKPAPATSPSCASVQK